jgi:DnaK suppressor protein
MPVKTAKKPVKSAAAKPAHKAAAKKASKPVAKKAKPEAKKPAPKAAKPVKKPAVVSSKPAVKSAPVKVQAKPVSSKPVSKSSTPAPVKRPNNGESLEFRGFTPYQERRGEEYMGPGQVDHFRHILNSWKYELMEKVDETVHHMQDEAANFPDPNDRASQESDFTMELRARDRERKLIKKIEESLQHLEDGDYGYCESCGVEIGIRRLEARPTATLCIDCKELDEMREKHKG